MRTDWECEKTKERNIKHMLDPVKIQTEYVNDISKITQEGRLENINYIFLENENLIYVQLALIQKYYGIKCAKISSKAFKIFETIIMHQFILV